MPQTADRTGRPGRPRSPEVIARDETIYKLIADGIGSRSALAQATGLDRPTVAECTKRLKKAARIRTCSDGGGMVWAVNDDTPCP
jgi:DNA invertase Pin-like site-specific DNA recombinase